MCCYCVVSAIYVHFLPVSSAGTRARQPDFFSQPKKNGCHCHVCAEGRVWSNSRFVIFFSLFFFRMAGVMAKGWSLVCGTRWIRKFVFFWEIFILLLWNCPWMLISLFARKWPWDSRSKIREFEMKTRKFENLRTSHRYKHHKEAWKAMVKRAMEKVLFSFFNFFLKKNTTRRSGKFWSSAPCSRSFFKHHEAWKAMGKRSREGRRIHVSSEKGAW